MVGPAPMAEDLAEERYESVVHRSPAQRNDPDSLHVLDVLARFAAKVPSEEIYREGQSYRLPWAIVRSPEENLDDRTGETVAFSSLTTTLSSAVQSAIPALPIPFHGRRGGCRVGRHCSDSTMLRSIKMSSGSGVNNCGNSMNRGSFSRFMFFSRLWHSTARPPCCILPVAESRKIRLESVKLAGVIVQHAQGDLTPQGSRLIVEGSGERGSAPTRAQEDPVQNSPGVRPVKQLGVGRKRE